MCVRDSGRGAGIGSLQSARVRATLGMCMWVKASLRLVRTMRIRVGVGLETEAWLRVGLREVA